jgi:hypothetical protein
LCLAVGEGDVPDLLLLCKVDTAHQLRKEIFWGVGGNEESGRGRPGGGRKVQGYTREESQAGRRVRRSIIPREEERLETVQERSLAQYADNMV